MKQIKCHCNRCSINLGIEKVYRTLIFACEDCRQALKWANKEDGLEPNDLRKIAYVDSDIESFSGLENMRAFQLRKGSKSTRIYCKECFSILAA